MYGLAKAYRKPKTDEIMTTPKEINNSWDLYLRELLKVVQEEQEETQRKEINTEERRE